MKTSSTLQKYYTTEQERLRQFIYEECRTDLQRAAVSVMALERCAPQLSLLVEQVPDLAGLSFYATILDDLEWFVCDGAVLSRAAVQGYEGWCLQMEKLKDRPEIRRKRGAFVPRPRNCKLFVKALDFLEKSGTIITVGTRLS